MGENNEVQVWQRVMDRRTPDAGRLGPLVLASREAAALYRHLGKTLQGRGKSWAGRLLAEELDTLAALQGLAVLTGEGVPPGKSTGPIQLTPARLTEQSYHRARSAAAEYTARSADSRTGLVFQTLAHREQSHCVLLAQILGSLPTP